MAEDSGRPVMGGLGWAVPRSSQSIINLSINMVVWRTFSYSVGGD